MPKILLQEFCSDNPESPKMKYLLLIAFVGLIWWVWKKRASGLGERSAPTAPKAERMVACAHCGLLMPRSDSIVDDGLHYCTDQHRRAGKSADKS